MVKKYPCPVCEKSFDDVEEGLHHITSEHSGIPSDRLQRATDSLETKKQLGDAWWNSSKNTFECPECYEPFPNSEKLNDHRKKVHDSQYTDAAALKVKEMEKFDEDNPPTCEKCNQKFLGLIVCKIDGVTLNACFNCYEEHYGPNMLQQLTLGTPNDIVEKIRKPL